MEFRLLGPLEVWHGDRALALGGTKQRALLAILLIHANEVVSRELLVDQLWGDEPPATAVHSLEVYISRLRKTLNGESAERAIETRPAGYLLRLESGQLDLERFEHLLDEGRRSLAAGDPETSTRVLTDALGLWRGRALADLGHEEFALAEVDRLEELRLCALEERLEAELALGRHEAIVGDLESFVAREPQRERPRLQLMLALYRGGKKMRSVSTRTRVASSSRSWGSSRARRCSVCSRRSFARNRDWSSRRARRRRRQLTVRVPAAACAHDCLRSAAGHSCSQPLQPGSS